MNNNKWLKYIINEDKGPFSSSTMQLFMPSVSQCNNKKCSMEHFRTNIPRDIKSMEWGNKPDGGLWTSSVIGIKEDKYGSEWTQWVREEMPDWFNPQGILIEVKTDNVYHISNNRDLNKLIREFPAKSLMGEKVVNWSSALSDQGYDGVHFGTKEGKWSDKVMMFGWDVESTCWRSDAIKKGLIEPIRIVEIYEK